MNSWPLPLTHQPQKSNITSRMIFLTPLILIALLHPNLSADVSRESVESISTPDKVESSIGLLKFRDGAPYPDTAEKLYDYLDHMRAVDSFLKGIQGASVHGLMKGARELGAKAANEVLIFDRLMNSESLFLTGNTSTIYTLAFLDLKRDGPTVLHSPPGVSGAFNDAWFRYVEDIGRSGPDKGRGGKYLVLPPDYKGNLPFGYFPVYPRSFRVWVFMRSPGEQPLEAAAQSVKDHLRIYPLSRKGTPPPMVFISASGKAFNTIHPNNYKFYKHLNEVIQYEWIGMLNPETRGLFASIGIEKGKAFSPDERMTKILTDAVAIGNGIARSIVWYPRTDKSLADIKIYPGTDSAWVMAFPGKNIFFNGPDGKTINSDARVSYFYPYTGVSPAMIALEPGKGSDYAIAFVDENKEPFDGTKKYKLHLPPEVPVNAFWAVNIYDSQTRSQLKTSQKFPSVSSQSKGVKQNSDGSYDIYFGPQAPKGFEHNWLETVPGKGFFVILRLYGPLGPWLEKTWRPGEVEPTDY
ncbi:DUF1254 domain-containing protein [Microbulbifer sp. JMSA002]|uniref:DUF1254 domain-containing protein n=1 Tax=Microbulbifer sp. JMSA002 TaxID=3243368 RepID=UPI00403A14AF